MVTDIENYANHYYLQSKRKVLIKYMYYLLYAAFSSLDNINFQSQDISDYIFLLR